MNFSSKMDEGMMLPWLYPLPLVMLTSFFLFLVIYTKRQESIWHSMKTSLLFRLPGQFLQEENSRILKKFTEDLLGIFVFTTIWFLLVIQRKTIANLASPVLCLLVSIWMIRVTSLLKKLRQNRVSIQCNQVVSQHLNRLISAGYHVFHDIDMNNGRMDHVVVGSNGIFAIETVSRLRPASWADDRALVVYDNGTLSYPGKKPSSELLETAGNKARQLQVLLNKISPLTARVIPIVCLPGWKVEQKKWVNLPVLEAHELEPYIRKYGNPLLVEKEITEICSVMEKLCNP